MDGCDCTIWPLYFGKQRVNIIVNINQIIVIMEPESIQSKYSSNKQSVEFQNVQPQYSCNENLKCKYCLNSYKSQEGDRIAIFKVGWASVKDYIIFEWAPLTKKTENVVTFNKHCLPSSSNEMYQLCYIDSENRTYGVSEPFQFVSVLTNVYNFDNSVDNITSVKGDTNSSVYSLGITNISLNDSNYSSMNFEKEVIHLKVENKYLRQSLQDIMGHIITMQKMLNFQQKEIDMLKERCNLDEDQRIQNTNHNLEILKNINNSFAVDFSIDDLESVPPFPFTK